MTKFVEFGEDNCINIESIRNIAIEENKLNRAFPYNVYAYFKDGGVVVIECSCYKEAKEHYKKTKECFMGLNNQEEFL